MQLTLEDGRFVKAACRALPPSILSASEVSDFAAQCDEGQALCFAGEDGMFVVQLRAVSETELELFVLVAVAFRFGAVERQDAALLQIARDLEAKTVAFESRRRGWGRRLGPEWTRRGLDEFVRDV